MKYHIQTMGQLNLKRQTYLADHDQSWNDETDCRYIEIIDFLS